MGLMTSVAATAALHLAGGVDQSFGALTHVHASTAPTTRPVLLVHGFGGSTSSWSFVARALSARGLTVDAMTYTLFGTSVEQLAERLVVEVERLLSHIGTDKMHLVGHSLGRVGIAQAVTSARLTGLIDTVVTLAAPFGCSTTPGKRPATNWNTESAGSPGIYTALVVARLSADLARSNECGIAKAVEYVDE
jgi:pimeloyl-ACP methyl ester carboxylesterase